MKTLCLTSIVLLCAHCRIVRAAPPTSRELALASIQFQGMKDSRERLVSGIFHVRGTDYRAYDPTWPAQGRPVKLSCLFDYTADRFRLDRDTGRTVVMHQVQPDEKDFEVPLRAIYVRRPEYSLHWRADSAGEVRRRQSNADPSRVVAPFNVRCLGLAFNAGLDKYFPYGKVYETCSSCKVIEVAETGDVCRVVLQHNADRGVFFTIWFNREQGCSPIRIELHLKAPSSLPLQRSETTWQEISGVWVPKAFVGEDFDSSGKVLSRKVELAFEWESVNEPVAEKHFTAAGMGLPPETRIITDELGTRIQREPWCQSALCH